MIEIDDFIMLGKTVPEPQRDNRIFVCSAGVSPQLRQLIRIYPLARSHAPQRWHVYRARIERPKPNCDSRAESWKAAGDRTPGPHEQINDAAFVEVRPAIPAHERRTLLDRYVTTSVRVANAERLSLAILHPSQISLNFEDNPESPDSPQLSLFDSGKPAPIGYRRFPYIPRIYFEDEEGPHNLMLRDWGCYELMRKRGNEYARENMAQALRLSPHSSLLIGNLNSHRTSWLVVSVLNGLREAAQLPIGDVA